MGENCSEAALPLKAVPSGANGRRWRAWSESIRRRASCKPVKDGSEPRGGDIGGNSKFDDRGRQQAAGGRVRPAERAGLMVLMQRSGGRSTAVVRRGSGRPDVMRAHPMHMCRSQQELRQQGKRREASEIALPTPVLIHARSSLQREAHYSETRWSSHVLLYNRDRRAIFRHRRGGRLAAGIARIYLRSLFVARPSTQTCNDTVQISIFEQGSIFHGAIRHSVS